MKKSETCWLPSKMIFKHNICCRKNRQFSFTCDIFQDPQVSPISFSLLSLPKQHIHIRSSAANEKDEVVNSDEFKTQKIKIDSRRHPIIHTYSNALMGLKQIYFGRKLKRTLHHIKWMKPDGIK